MARMKDLEFVKTGNLFRIPPERLVEESGFNLRLYTVEDEERIEQYAQMFMAGSRCPPLCVRLRGEDVVLIDGHLRRRAALLAISRGAPIVDVDCFQFSGNDEDRLLYMVQSGAGRSWLPIELLEGYKRFKAYGWPESKIAEKVGKTEKHVRDILLLANANSDVQRMVRNGDVSATLAIETVRQEGEGAAEILNAAAEAALEEGRTHATAKHVKAVREKRGKRPPPVVPAPLDALLAEVERQLTANGLTAIDLPTVALEIEGRFFVDLMNGGS